MKIKYVGQAPQVLIAATGEIAIRGEPVEVDADLGKSLLEQETWQKVTERKKEKESAD